MPRNKKVWALLVTGVVAAGLFFFLEKGFLPADAQKSPPHDNFKVLESVVRYIRNDYVEEPDPQKTMEGAFQGLVNSLDSLSGYLDKAGAAKYLVPQRRQLKDVGIVLFKRPGAIPLVVGVVEKSPAEKAGIRIGDYLSAVDDRSTLVWSLSEINLYLKDVKAGPIKLRVIRDNSTKEIQAARADIYTRALTLTVQDGTAGVVRVHHLYPPAAADFGKDILPRLRDAKESLILDLRDCHEGDNEEARALLNVFLKTESAGYFEQKGGEKDVLSCPDSAPLAGLPVIVWVNQATMGPAEILAGVLKNQKKAKIVGTATPGLAAKQSLFHLANGDALLLSTGVFCYDSGEKLWGKGIDPDVKLDPGKTDTKAYTEKTLSLLTKIP